MHRSLSATALAFALAACGGGGTDEEAFEPQAAVVAPAVTPGSVPSAPGADQVVFSGHTFQVRSGAGGPGPNTWSTQNVWVDGNGWLHLKISQQAGQWTAAEVYTTEALGFGTYQFKIAGHPEALDDNVVLGLFNYPTPDVGPDGTNEIDIEFATWGGAQPQHGNWTVWPATAATPLATHPWNPLSTTGASTHQFTWSAKSVAFQSLDGKRKVASWNYAPRNAAAVVPQQAMPLHMNFWLFQGQAPTDAQEAEIVVTQFTFTARRR
ncbi:glycoside hydrolase family 16 protein [Ramlibacter sp. PS4R-6]|uniref:glycoside hydrolase family 16 protein n=1 Tax=Ramlibacter sp. PS4R-6 TaxID=3133438 RepID=UPI0030A23A8A